MNATVTCPKCSAANTIYSDNEHHFTCDECSNKFTLTEQRARKRIFLSWGQDAPFALALRLKKDLEDRQHEVWFDQNRRILGKSDCSHKTSEGITWAAASADCGFMVFLVTPLSAREPDGLCMNELKQAIERKLIIIPVIIEWCEIPKVIRHMQWLDMSGCVPLAEREAESIAVFHKLAGMVEAKQPNIFSNNYRLHDNLIEGPFKTLPSQLPGFVIVAVKNSGEATQVRGTRLSWTR